MAAKQIELKDPNENLGTQMLRQTAERTGDLVGDGTTTSGALSYSALVALAIGGRPASLTTCSGRYR